MLQYLINMTAIWVLSLAAFDIFFRHESYHGYNRAYLLSTFLLGIVLPGFAWHNSTFEYTSILGRSVEQTSAIRQTISNTASNNTPTIDWQQYLEYIYLVGVVISSILLIVEGLKIFKLYKNGDKLKEGKWIIVETHKGHSPFSLGKYIFTGSKGQYREAEWQIIVAHEKQHGNLLHFIDLLLMQLAHIVFWFHPLVYIYNKRLLLLHEYQADASIQVAPVQYGHFLVEQSMLQTSPVLSHSFIRSPIKSRILMLTKRSSSLSKGKLLLTLPLVAICLLCFTKNSFSGQRKWHGDTVTYNGNTIETAFPKDTMVMLNPTTGQNITKVTTLQVHRPTKLNGAKIYMSYEIPTGNTPANEKSTLTGDVLKEYLVDNLKSEFKNLSDGKYYIVINNVVVNEK